MSSSHFLLDTFKKNLGHSLNQSQDFLPKKNPDRLDSTIFTLLKTLCDYTLTLSDAKKYSREHFHPEHHTFGILQLTDGCFTLHIVKTPLLSEPLNEENQHFTVQIDKHNRLKFKTFHSNVFLTEEESDALLFRTLLLNYHAMTRHTSAINFHLSLKEKRIVTQLVKTEFPEDIYICITFVQDAHRLLNAAVIENKINQSTRRSFVKFFHIVLNNPDNLVDELSAQMKIQRVNNITFVKKIRIYLNAHCDKGKSTLQGFYTNKNNETIHPTWDASAINTIFYYLGIQKDQEIFIDVLACKAGESSLDKPAFVTCLAKKMEQESFVNTRIRGNKQLTYSPIYLKEFKENSLIEPVGRSPSFGFSR